MSRIIRHPLSYLMLLIVAAVLLLPAAQAQDGAAPAAPDGVELYFQNCAACHMIDGSGAEGAGKYPNLAGNPVVEASADFVLLRILKGFGAMPPYAGMLNDSEIAAIVNHVRGTLNAAADEIGADKVAELR